jgi:glyoxylase-like metal-dependent hydrolase (beta-lactamase superfamily II)
LLGRTGTGGELLPVVDGIWCLRQAGRRSAGGGLFRFGAGASCSYLIAAADGIVVVDPGPGAASMAATLATLGRGPAGVSAILLTHWHEEMGAADLRDLTGAPLHYHPAEAPLLAGRGQEADVLVRDGDQVAGGTLRVVASPGHSPGHVCYFHPSTGTLFAGHALTVAGGELRLGARPAAADVPAARRSIARCLELPIEHVCPGRREPLSDRAGEKARATRSRILTGARWPLLG